MSRRREMLNCVPAVSPVVPAVHRPDGQGSAPASAPRNRRYCVSVPALLNSRSPPSSAATFRRNEKRDALTTPRCPSAPVPDTVPPPPEFLWSDAVSPGEQCAVTVPLRVERRPVVHDGLFSGTCCTAVMACPSSASPTADTGRDAFAQRRQFHSPQTLYSATPSGIRLT